MTDQELNRFYAIIGQRIAEARKNASLKQEPFAEMFKLSRASIVNIEKGRQKSSLHLLWEISKKLKIDFTQLLPSTTISSDVEKIKIIGKQIGRKVDKESKRKILTLIENITEKT